MKKHFSLLTIFITTVIFSSCLKDVGKRSYKVYTPITAQTATLRSQVKSMLPVNVTNAGKLFIIGNYIFLNEKNKGVHVIDNTNPASPINKSFINIPGCYDMAVIDNTLYADCYTDLLTLDISDVNNIVLKNYFDDIFSDKRNINGYVTNAGTVVVDWIVKDTVIDIEIGEGQGIWKNNSYIYNGTVASGGVFSTSTTAGGNNSTTTGIAGSMSRFALINNYLYAVSNSTLHSILISNPQQPVDVAKQSIGWNIETIYPFKDKLFIGSQTGMMIYSLANAANPTYVSGFSHARLCDPVIADDNFAYITLHASEDKCSGTQNELDIVDITNINTPTLITRVNLSKPQGLSKSGNTVFVCDGDAGIRVIDVSNKNNPVIKQTIPLAASYDIICNNGIAIVSAQDGIHQYDYSNINNVVKLSSFNY